MVGGTPADVAVCTLSTVPLASHLSDARRVAIAAPMATANLGIENLILGALRLPGLCHLIVCGRDSPLFRQGQSLLAMVANGCRPDGTIVGAAGYRAEVSRLSQAVVSEFRRQVSVHNMIGTEDADLIRKRIDELPPAGGVQRDDRLDRELVASGLRLRKVRGGGRRKPVAAGGEGYFVVTVDRTRRRVVLRHYAEDLSTGHEVTARTAEALLLRVVELGLLTEPAHAGYLGGELAKAETAMRLGLPYIQDRPLRDNNLSNQVLPGRAA